MRHIGGAMNLSEGEQLEEELGRNKEANMNEDEHNSADDEDESANDEELHELQRRKHNERASSTSIVSILTLEMTFRDAKAMRVTIVEYSIREEVSSSLGQNEKNRVGVECQSNCHFRLLISKDKRIFDIKAKNFILEHSSVKVFKNPRVSAKLLASKFKKRVHKIPNLKIKEM